MALVTNDLQLIQGLYSGSSVYADEMLVFHISKGWATQPGVHGNIVVASSDDGEAQILCASSDDGSIFRLDYGASRDGAEMQQVFMTPWIDFGSPTHRKWIRRLVLETDSDARDIKIELAVDYSDIFDYVLNDGGAAQRVRWLPATHPAAVRWLRKSDPACARWRSAVAKRTVDFPITVHCRAVRIRLSGKALKIIGLGIGWMVRGT